MTEPHDSQQTLDHSPADELDAGLAAAFGPPTTPGGFSLPPLLPDPDGADDPVVQPASPAMPTTGAGRYQLLGELARGGMGVVLWARDPDLGRDLAVKVLREELCGRPAVLRRFVEEAQVGGQLQHPGCVPVHELGTFADGRPYFTMKLVRGQTLAALLAERPSPGHDRPRFLHVFEQVCQAVAYAHAKGVIHRDLKPANVMVGGFGEVQVMDWGLAKVLARGGVADEERASRGRERPEEGPAEIRTVRSGSAGSETEAGSVVGTPAYMPPEQAAGEVELVDERADVFGLGAVLCVILTGEPPYAGRDPTEVRRQAIRGDLAECRARLDGCGAENELVGLAKSCLAEEPGGRPRDAGAVAQAVAAHRQGVEERARRADRERAAAEARAGEAKATAAAERKARRRTALLGVALLLLVAGGGGSGWWLSLERAQRRADEQRAAGERDAAVAAALPAVAAARDTGRWLEARAVLEQAERRLGDGGPDDLRGRLRRARADLELAADLEGARLRGTEAGYDDFGAAGIRAAYAAAFARHGLPAEEMPPAELAARVRASAARDALVAALDEWWYTHPDPAVAARLREAAGLADPDDWRAAIRLAAAAGDRAALERLAADPVVDRQPAVSLLLLALALEERKGEPAAAALLRRARRAHPADFWVHHTLGACLAKARPPALAEAEGAFRAALALRPQSPVAHYSLGYVLSNQPGQLAEAEAAYREAVHLRPSFAQAHCNLGALLAKQSGRAAEAEQAYRAALDHRPDLVQAHRGLGYLLAAQPGRAAEAERAYRDALRHRPDDPLAHSNLGALLAAQAGRGAEAEAAYKKAIGCRPDLAEAHFNLGNLLAKQPGRAAEAEAAYRAAVRLRPDDPLAHSNLGALLAKQPGRAAEAERAFRDALRHRPDWAEVHCNLGALLAKQPGRAAEAERAYRDALHHRPDLVQAHSNLGYLLAAQPGRAAEAERAYRDALRHRPDFAEAHCNLGLLLGDQGRFAEALAELRRGHELGASQPGWRYPSAVWVRRCERLAELEAKLPAALADPAAVGADDQAELARMCLLKRRPVAGVRLYSAAFERAPRLATSPANNNRYNAACAASLAAAGRADAAAAPAKLRASLRRQALAWLQADLARWSEQVDDPKGRPKVAQALRHWQQDADLAGVRDPAELAKLPPDERAEWEKFWKEVVAVLERAGGTK